MDEGLPAGESRIACRLGRAAAAFGRSDRALAEAACIMVALK
jgi:hypothetical protein